MEGQTVHQHGDHQRIPTHQKKPRDPVDLWASRSLRATWATTILGMMGPDQHRATWIPKRAGNEKKITLVKALLTMFRVRSDTCR